MEMEVMEREKRIFLNREKCDSSPDPRSLVTALLLGGTAASGWSVTHRSRRKEAINVGVPTRGYSWLLASFYLFLRSKYGLVSEPELFPPTAGPTPTKLKLFCTFHLMDGSWMTREGT